MTTAIPQEADVWSALKDPRSDRLDRLHWLHWHPSQLEACTTARAEHLPRPLDDEELTELRQAHERWGAGRDSLDALEQLGRPETRVIVAGQQPGLLAGPLLIQYKTMAAIHLARRLQEQFPQYHWVPVFWIASEDHDFDEIRRVFWPGHSGQLEEFLLPQQLWKRGQMVGRIPLTQVAERLKGLIELSTFKTEFGPEIMRMLAEVYGGDADLESGFARIMTRLFAGTGLVLVSPLMNWVKQRARPIFEHEFQHPGRSSEKVIERGAAMSAAGLTPTVHRLPEALNAFWTDGDGRRYTLRLNGGEVHRALPQGDDGENVEQPPLALENLRALLAEDPSQFSMNVVTRPLVQDSCLPVVAQAIGPGEAAYLAQVEAVYEDFGVFSPVRYPRPQVTLIEPRVARNLEKYKIDIGEIFAMDSVELVQTVVRRDMQASELQDIDQTRLAQIEQIQRLRTAYADSGPAIESAFDKLILMMEKGYARIVERMLYQRQQDEHSLRQALALLSNSLRPNEQAQGRQLNAIVPFAINYGLDWIGRLMPLIDFDAAAPMQLIDLSKLAEKPDEQRTMNSEQ